MQKADYEELLRLRELVKSQTEQMAAKDAEIEQQRVRIENLTQAVLHARKKMYGPSSEVTGIPGQISLFGGEELAEELAEQQKTLTVSEHKRKARQPGVRAEMLSSLPVEVERCLVDEASRCPVCGSGLIKVGEKVIRTEVVYEPAVLKVKQYIQEIKKCRNCGTAESTKETPTFVGARLPGALLPHSIAGPSLISGILYQKYDMGIPLARQERDWYRLGLEIHRSTMSHWVIRCSQEWLEPVWKRMHQVMLGCGVLQGDETRIQCNREPGKKAESESFMWVMRTGSFEPLKGVLFHYARTRSGDEARELYAGFQGYLVTDGYTGYEKVEGITRSLCWSHLRRYYVESIPLDSSGRELQGSKGSEARDQCDRLFRIERKLKGQEPQERLEKRKKLIQPLLEDFWTWVEETSQKYTTNESLKRALQYSRNQKKYLNTFMEDGRLPLSNNECESCIRPFATGRKSWLFADSPEGAKASGIVYSLVETAKLNHLDVFQYLKYLLEQMPGLEYRYQNAPSMLDPYLPWSMELPESCRMKKKRR